MSLALHFAHEYVLVVDNTFVWSISVLQLEETVSCARKPCASVSRYCEELYLLASLSSFYPSFQLPKVYFPWFLSFSLSLAAWSGICWKDVSNDGSAQCDGQASVPFAAAGSNIILHDSPRWGGNSCWQCGSHAERGPGVCTVSWSCRSSLARLPCSAVCSPVLWQHPWHWQGQANAGPLRLCQAQLYHHFIATCHSVTSRWVCQDFQHCLLKFISPQTGVMNELTYICTQWFDWVLLTKHRKYYC